MKTKIVEMPQPIIITDGEIVEIPCGRIEVDGWDMYVDFIQRNDKAYSFYKAGTESRNYKRLVGVKSYDDTVMIKEEFGLLRLLEVS